MHATTVHACNMPFRVFASGVRVSTATSEAKSINIKWYENNRNKQKQPTTKASISTAIFTLIPATCVRIQCRQCVQTPVDKRTMAKPVGSCWLPLANNQVLQAPNSSLQQNIACDRHFHCPYSRLINPRCWRRIRFSFRGRRCNGFASRCSSSLFATGLSAILPAPRHTFALLRRVETGRQTSSL